MGRCPGEFFWNHCLWGADTPRLARLTPQVAFEGLWGGQGPWCVCHTPLGARGAGKASAQDLKSEVTAGGLDRLMAAPAAVADGSILFDAAAPAGDTNAQNRANTLASRFDAEAYWAGNNGKGGGAPQYHSMDTPRGPGKGRGGKGGKGRGGAGVFGQDHSEQELWDWSINKNYLLILLE